MSTKTNFKRVALVAVASLGLGVLTSVAPASATDFTTAETLAFAHTNSATATSITAADDLTTFTSLGVITTTGGTLVAASGSDKAYKTRTAGTSATGVVYPTAQLQFSVSSATKSSIVVSGGTISSAETNTSLNGSATVAVNSAATAMSVVVKPGVAAGSTFTVSAYTGANVTSTTPTSGVLTGVWTFTVGASSAAGLYSPTYSVVAQQAGIAKSGTAAGTNTYDTTTRLDNGQVGVVYVSLADAYGSAITSGTLAVSATNSATVVMATSPGAGGAYAATTSFATLAHSAPIWISVNQPVANTAGSSTVTITLDGQVVGTKTVTWAGDIATLAVDTANSAGTFAIGLTTVTGNTASIGNVVYVAKDAAGNIVNLSAQPTIADSTGSLVGASMYTGDTGTAGGEYQDTTMGYGYTTMFLPASTVLQGAGTYQLKITNAAGVTIKSAVISAKASNGGTYTFSVSWDKASYVSGDIATMSISAKDSFGNAVAEGTYLTGLSLAVNSGGFQDLSACAATSAFSTGGTKKCKYAVLNDAGSYAYSVGLSSGSLQTAVIGTVPVSVSSAGVSNADVLKAIVSLIASINKQIAALQKALLKR
jgi:hypothetical protein